MLDLLLAPMPLLYLQDLLFEQPFFPILFTDLKSGEAKRFAVVRRALLGKRLAGSAQNLLATNASFLVNRNSLTFDALDEFLN